MRYFFLIFNIILFSVTAVHANSFCSIINNNIEIRVDPNRNADLINSEKTNLFGKSFDIKETSAGFLHIYDGETEIGWIRAKDENKYYLKNNVSLAKNYIEALKVAQLIKKAIVVNKIEDNEQIAVIEIYPNSSLSGTPINKITIFELRYIFASTDNAVLVGKHERIAKSNSEFILTGWINKKYVLDWNNRIGMEFNKANYQERKNNRGKVFYSERDLRKNKNILSIEKDTSYPMPYYANRYPQLEKKRSSNKIIYIGGGSSKNKDGTSFTATAEEIDSARNELADIIHSTGVKVAFLIDATMGMRNHIESVKTALDRFIRVQRGESKNSLVYEVAIVVYRDYPDGAKKFEVISDFTNNFQNAISALNSVAVIGQPNDKGIGTYPEALFYSIANTISDRENFSDYVTESNSNNQLNWGNNKIGKYIVLIGDHGNHEDYSQYPQDRKYTTNIISKMLVKNHISLYALQVNRSSPVFRRYSNMFKKQISRINGTDSVFAKLIPVNDNSTDDVLRALGETKLSYGILKDVAISVRDRPRDEYPEAFVHQVLERFGIDPRIFEAVQGCAIAFVSENNSDGKKQVSRRVLLTKQDVELIKTQMNILATKMIYYDPLAIDEVKKTIKNVVKALSGDTPAEGELISEFIEKKSGIPILTEMLAYSVKELLQQLESDDFRMKLNRYIKEKIIGLEEVVRQKVLINVTWVPDEQTFSYDVSNTIKPYFFSMEQPIRNRARGKIADSKKTHVWLPMIYLP